MYQLSPLYMRTYLAKNWNRFLFSKIYKKNSLYTLAIKLRQHLESSLEIWVPHHFKLQCNGMQILYEKSWTTKYS